MELKRYNVPVIVRSLRDILQDNSDWAQWLKTMREATDVKPSEEYTGLLQFEKISKIIQIHIDELLSLEEHDWAETIRQYFVMDEAQL